ncbi:acyl-CoA dehydrogenase [Halobacillus faecis]
MEKRGNLAPEIMEELYRQRFFQLLVPKQLGGRISTLPETLKVYEQASFIDGNLGWLLAVCTGNMYLLKSLREDIYRKYLSNDDTVLSGSGFPTGSAKPVPGGYQINGEWKFCSGSSIASFFMMNAKVDHGEGESSTEVRSIIFKKDQVKVMDDWNAFGLKATNSHTLIVEDEFVQDEWTMAFHLSGSNYEDPLLRYPFFQFAKSQFASIGLGIAGKFLLESKVVAEKFKDEWRKSGRNDFVLNKIQAAEKRLTDTKNSFDRVISQTWNLHIQGDELSEDHLKEVSHVCENAAKEALKSAQSIYNYLGISAVLEDTVINKTYRDLHTACQHGLIVSFRD